MSGWIPTPADGWPLIAEALTAGGAPWPEAAVVTDLRWWVDQRGRALAARGVSEPTAAQLVEGVPGRPTLMARWARKDNFVKKILKDTLLWWDSARWGDAPTPVDRQVSASRAPAERQPLDGSNGTIERKSPTDRQVNASAAPAERHTRGDPPSPSTLTLETDTPTPAEPAGALAPGEGAKAERPALAEIVALPAPRTAIEEEPTEADAVPAWARGHRGHRSVDVLGLVVRVLESVRQRPVADPHRCATDARSVIALWRALEHPPPDELAADLDLVARWARESSDHLAENDIRGVRADGARWGPDRSLSVATLCTQTRWADRLDAARRWASGAATPGAYVRGDHPAAQVEAAPTLKLTKEQRERWWE